MNYTRHILSLSDKHSQAFYFAGITSIVLIIIGVFEESLAKVFVYLGTMVGCFLISEWIYFTRNAQYEPWKMKEPRNELWVIIATQVIVAILLIVAFLIVDQQQASPIFRIITLILRLLFVFPVFFLIYFIGLKKYGLRELGFTSLKNWFVALPLIVMIGGISYLIFPEGFLFKSALEDHGFMSFITFGFLTAAIPEEITRTLFQSRLGSVLKSKSIAWFLVSLIWALLHIPIFVFRIGDFNSAFIGAIGILPIGLLWGYLNERYRSIIPAVLIHGTNLWGISNVF